MAGLRQRVNSVIRDPVSMRMLCLLERLLPPDADSRHGPKMVACSSWLHASSFTAVGCLCASIPFKSPGAALIELTWATWPWLNQWRGLGGEMNWLALLRSLLLPCKLALGSMFSDPWGDPKWKPGGMDTTQDVHQGKKYQVTGPWFLQDISWQSLILNPGSLTQEPILWAIVLPAFPNS